MLTATFLLATSISGTSGKIALAGGLSAIVAVIVDRWKAQKQQQVVMSQQLFKSALVDNIKKSIAVVATRSPNYSIVDNTGKVKLMSTDADLALRVWEELKQADSSVTWAFLQDGQVRSRITPNDQPTVVDMRLS